MKLQYQTTAMICRWFLLVLLACGLWGLARSYDGLPAPRGLEAPQEQFSAARADAVLGRILGPEIPHPVASAENDNVRARIVAAFAALGIQAGIDQGFACNADKDGSYIGCATVNNIVADVIPGAGKAVILLAHYDSVAAGPGAADDGAGVAAVLETVRALRAIGTAGHPVLAVITDGEEAGLLGARRFLDNPDLKSRVGVVLNVEARGNRGPSLLFQTSDGNAKLIELYARNAATYAASSLFPAIYKLIPNDTDLTLFLEAGFKGVNFACIGGIAHYHTPLDRRQSLSTATLQHQGDNLLGMARGLVTADFAALTSEDAIFLSVFGHSLLRLNAVWAMPLALAILMAVIAAGGLWKEEPSATRLPAFLVPPAVILIAVGAGEVVAALAAHLSHQPDPSYAHPAALRVALAFCVLLSAVLCARFTGKRAAAIAVWFWTALAAVIAGLALPGIAPYFLFPGAIGAAALLVRARMSPVVGDVLLALAALGALAVWMPVVVQGEDLMGLVFQPLFTVPATLGILPLLVFMIGPVGRQAWAATCAGIAGLALASAVVAGMQPAYSTNAPQRLNISFIDDHVAGKATWVVDTTGALPQSLATAAHFEATYNRIVLSRLEAAYVAEAGPLRFPTPKAAIENAAEGAGMRTIVSLADPFATDIKFIAVPAHSGLSAVEMDGRHFDIAAETEGRTVIHCVGDDCRTKPISLIFNARQPVDLTIGAQHSGLPKDAAPLLAARPATAVPSSGGDRTVAFGKFTIAPPKDALAD